MSSEPRADLLDALRGFAICGILLGNVQHLSGWSFLSREQRALLPGAPVNDVASFLINWFVEGKFYSLFSLLFGIGFAVLLVRAERDGRDFVAFFRRRLRLLLGFGLVHAYLIWPGDILTLYALLGFALLAFRTRSDTALLRWTLVLFALPIIQYAVIMVFVGGIVPDADAMAANREFMDGLVLTMSSGTWPEITRVNIGGVIFGRYPELIFTGRPFKVLATFLIGLWIGRHRVWAEPHAHLPLLRRVAVTGLAVGLPLNLGLAVLMRGDGYYLLQPIGLVHSVVYGIGVPALALGYAASFALLWQRLAVQRVFSRFVSAGRLALTNYIGQSVIATAIFNGWGLGWFGRLGLAASLGIALLILGAQLVGSRIWLRAYRFGPLEWVWRSLTYGARQPMRQTGTFVPAAPHQP
jgi:uncharacterized protein